MAHSGFSRKTSLAHNNKLSLRNISCKMAHYLMFFSNSDFILQSLEEDYRSLTVHWSNLKVLPSAILSSPDSSWEQTVWFLAVCLSAALTKEWEIHCGWEQASHSWNMFRDQILCLPSAEKAIIRVVCIIYYFGLSMFLLPSIPRTNENEPNYSGLNRVLSAISVTASLL